MNRINMKTELVQVLREGTKEIASRNGLTLSQVVDFFRNGGLQKIPHNRRNETVIRLFDSVKWLCSVETSKVIVMSSEQADIFLRLRETHMDSLDYKLPFETVLIQFDDPVAMEVEDGTGKAYELLGLLLEQICVSREQYDRVREIVDSEQYVKPDFSEDREVYVNTVVTIGRRVGDDYYLFSEAKWQSADHHQWLANYGDIVEYGIFRDLAIACIGYINCENIYLHQEGGAADSVNRKRAKQGKKILEPYYVCRIRGVQYDSNGNPTGEGTHHGFRYDVRGHFRKLSTGKTTWVRPHQRGLQNELYIPKTYLVTKKVEPA